MTRRDGEEDDPTAPPRRTRTFAPPHQLAKQMREQLLQAGIDLDEHEKEKARGLAALQRAETDREKIRAILEPLGAPEWMIASCPSVELANEYAKKQTEKP